MKILILGLLLLLLLGILWVPTVYVLKKRNESLNDIRVVFLLAFQVVAVAHLVVI